MNCECGSFIKHKRDLKRHQESKKHLDYVHFKKLQEENKIEDDDDELEVHQDDKQVEYEDDSVIQTTDDNFLAELENQNFKPEDDEEPKVDFNDDIKNEINMIKLEKSKLQLEEQKREQSKNSK